MKMKWYHYLAAFAAGFFLTNTLPHLTQGVTGQSFPTPFSDPPGKGLSSPLVNVLWGCPNVLVGYLFWRVSGAHTKHGRAMLTLFIGVLTASVMLSFSFSNI